MATHVLHQFGRRFGPAGVCAAAVMALGAGLAQAQSVYYICPGNVFTNTINAKAAEQRGCKARETREPTTVAAPKRRAPAAADKPADSKVDAQEQRDRDSDARRILQAELDKEQAALDQMKRDYNNGEPERLGSERNAQKYLDRIAEMKAAIARKEADIAALKRELAKAGGSAAAM